MHQGFLLAQEQRYAEAIPFFLADLRVHPNNALTHQCLGKLYHSLDDMAQARLHYQNALHLCSPQDPAIASLLSALGMIVSEQQAFDEAIPYFEQALLHDPNEIKALMGLGQAFLNTDQCYRALSVLQKALSLNPRVDRDRVHYLLGLCYIRMNDLRAAAPFLEQALQSFSEPNLLYHLGLCAMLDGKKEEAKNYYVQSLEQKTPQPLEDKKVYSMASHNIAHLFLEENNKEKALFFFQQSVHYDPNNESADYMASALMNAASGSKERVTQDSSTSSKPLPQRAPIAFVQALFDQYAPTYNQHLVEGLHYQLPALLRSCIQNFMRNTPWIVADIGCGTGLCAPYFNDVALKMYGFDLSQAMLKQAALLQAYYRLIPGDFLSSAQEFVDFFDLCLAAEYLTYQGDLVSFSAVLYSVLKDQGLFIGNYQKNHRDYTEQDYVLLESGRYSHAPSYIHHLFSQPQWVLLYEGEHPSRLQEGEWLSTQIVIIQKRARTEP